MIYSDNNYGICCLIASIKHSQFVKKMIKIPLNIQDFYLETEDVTIERAQRVKPYENKKIKARPHLGQ